MVSVALVFGSLLAVVVGHALLAQGQVRLSSVQNTLSAEQARHRQEQLATVQLEMPSRIVAQAQRLGMVLPSQVTQLPSVPLNVPEPPPSVGSAPGTSRST